MVAPWSDLTLPQHHDRTMREVLNATLPWLVRDLSRVPAPTDPTLRKWHAQLTVNVKASVHRDPRRLVRVLRQPVVRVALAESLRPNATPERVAELVLLVLWDLALRGELEHPVTLARWGTQWPCVRSLTMGLCVQLHPDVHTLSLQPNELSLNHEALAFAALATHPLAAVSQGFARLRDGLALALTDNNPLAHVPFHPERGGNAVDLAGEDVAHWQHALTPALEIIDRYLPSIAAEFRLGIQVLVPSGRDPERHFSCSYDNAPGAIYLSLHPNVMTLAEALVHEFQHNKLHYVMRLDPLLNNPPDAVYRSPLRPDDRPLLGVLMAVHAYQPIARLYEAMTAAHDPLSLGRDWDKRFRDVLAVNRDGADVVRSHAQPTAQGALVLKEMLAIEQHFQQYAATRWGR